ncbi:MAG: sulfatase-like hydrolase/transferase [Verrucomicrobia bacterium]|nr:sulfatase-like hydrolase/transferase [Verrucomicrobiota bacterium]
MSKIAKYMLPGVLAALLVSCSGRVDRPNVILVTMDTTRADRIGCYGCERAFTPGLDALAKSGVLFERAYTAVPLTLPSHTSILTGLQPPEHGLRVNGARSLSRETTLLSEALKTAKYQTAAFIAAFVLDAKFGLDQGFDLYDDDVGGDFDPDAWLRRHRSGEKVVDSALEWLRGRSSDPFFCWVHLFDPHQPYIWQQAYVPENFAGDAYDSEIAYMDFQIRRLLDYVKEEGIAERTLVVLVGDHGESLGEHGEKQHGLLLYDGAVHVPMIFVQPGKLPSGRIVSGAVSIASVAPTIARLCGVTLSTASAPSLHRALRDSPTRSGPVYMETEMPYTEHHWAPLRGLVDYPWKYIHTSRPELYNLQSDPAEMRNLCDLDPNKAAKLAALLDELERSFREVSGSEVELSETERRTLESLGYTTRFERQAGPDNREDLPDVKDMLDLFEESQRVGRLIKAGELAVALDLAAGLVEKDPENAAFRLALAKALGANGKYKEAEDLAARRILASGEPLSLDVRLGSLILLSRCRKEQGDVDGAVSILREILATDEDNVPVRNGLAWYLATKSDASAEERSEAVEIAEGLIDVVGPEAPRYLDTLATAHAAAGDFESAVRYSSSAVRFARRDGDDEMIKEYRRRLSLFEAGKPYFE